MNRVGARANDMNDKRLLDQSTCRKVGAITVALAALMAVYAVGGGVLRDSVVHLSRFSAEDAVEQTAASRPGLFCLVYWLVFLLLILMSLYLAVLNIRFIRLKFAREKQALMQENLARPSRRNPSRDDGDG